MRPSSIRSIATLLVVGAAASLHAQGAPQAGAATTAAVRVEVRHGGVPVEAATVRAGRVGALTGPDGLALLRLIPGTHVVVASRIGLASDSMTLSLRAGQDTTIRLVLAASAADLESIVISSTRGDRRIEDEPLRVEVITREEVEEKLLMTPGDISMLLNETSGLRVQTTSPSLGGAAVRIQGLGGRYTQVLSDGLPLYGGQAGGLGLLQIPPMDLAQVEVIKGAASAFYGSQALGGVVNLISRRAGAERTREVLLNRTSRAGTDAILFAAAPISANLSYTLLGGFHHQARSDVDRDGWTDLPGYQRVVLRPRLAWENGSGSSLFVTAGLTDEDREGGTMPNATAPNGLPYREALKTQRADLGIVGRRRVGDAFVSTRFALADQRHAHRFGPVTEDDTHRTLFGEATLLLPGERVSTVLGVALQRESYANASVTGFDFTHTAPGLFALVDLDPAPWFALAATARLDSHSEYGTILTPRVSALVRAAESSRWEGWTARLSAGSGVFAPTALTEETEVTGLTALVPLGSLTVERATTAAIDLGGPVGALEVNVSIFGARVANPLGSVEEPPLVPGGPTRLRLLNVGAPTRTFGSELLVRYVAAPWHLTGSYAHLRVTELSPDLLVREDSPLVPRDAIGIVGMYEMEGKGRIGLELYLTGPQALENNPYRSESPGYAIVGALVERQFGAVRAFVNFENLTDVRLTRYDRLVLPVRGRGGRWTTDAWTELAGRTVNGGVRFAF